VKRNDRLAAIVSHLRATAPRPCSAESLAGQFAVSARTIERDIVALQRTGVPIWVTPGRLGGYTIDPGEALPPVELTVPEMAALAQALALPATMPYAHAARTARAKLVAALSASAVEGAGDLGTRLALAPVPQPIGPGVPRIIEQAVLERQVLALTDADGAGHDVEPLALARGGGRWFVVGWARLRSPNAESGLRGPNAESDGRARSFALDAIAAVHPTGRSRPDGLPVDGDTLEALLRQPERFDR
jgi:predicted DNA-binding transcriptional regulator YafY